jgi:hypothetical protein
MNSLLVRNIDQKAEEVYVGTRSQGRTGMNRKTTSETVGSGVEEEGACYATVAFML